MAITFNVSSSLECLAEALVAQLNASEKTVFQQDVIVTQTEGMNNWLVLQIAERSGIAANIRFMQPSELIFQLYQYLSGPFRDLLAPANLSWLLYKILGTEEFVQRFPEIGSYYGRGGTDQDLKRLALAEKMADLFDQYQIYRPAMMREWNRNAATASKEWQQYLWNAAREASGSDLPDKSFIGDFILEALNEPVKQNQLKARMPELHFFGLSITTDYHVQILHEVAKVIDVHIHILNPAPDVYWYEDLSEKQIAAWRMKGLPLPEHVQQGNRLLSSWGKIAKDTFTMFFQYDAFMNAYEVLNEEREPADSLLRKIQEDIYTAASEETSKISKKELFDDSLVISSSFTPAREVEALYNHLLHLLEKRDSGLAPRDIVVMVSDIDLYAPYINAVFNNAPFAFRFSIADKGYAGGDNLFEALDAVLRMNEDGFTSEEVVQLLELSFIRKRFGIEDSQELRNLVNAANIRFGFDGRKDDDTRFVSWRYGLKRIIYGICMSGEEAFEVGDEVLYPLDLIEGSETREAVHFCHFVEVLISSIEERRSPRKISEWVTYVEQVLQNLIYEPGDDTDQDHQRLVKTLSSYRLVEEWMPEPVSYEVFSRSLLQTLRSASSSGAYVSGGITFCALIPMRSIPFKVVAMLGLDYDKFPRKERMASFNLMLQAPKRGDRNVRDNDKHLFLETILSAREHLYISYVGRKAKDNTVRPPSAMVDELLDYIARGSGMEPEELRDAFVVQHPLHNYSHFYNKEGGRLRNYLSSESQSVIPRKTAAEAPSDTLDELRLDELFRFCKDPIKTYYNRVLEIRYEREELLLSETECFDLDNLQAWNLKSELLECDKASVNQFLEKSRRVGGLPLANMAKVALSEVNEVVDSVRQAYEAVKAKGPHTNLEFEIEVDDTLLMCRIEKVFGSALFVASWSSNPLKAQLEAYLQLLAGSAAGLLSELWFVEADKEPEVIPALSKEIATEQLKELIELYKSGLQEPLPFSVSIVRKISKKNLLSIDEGIFQKAVNEVLNSEYGTDEYLAAECRSGCISKDNAWKRFEEIMSKILGPVWKLFPETK